MEASPKSFAFKKPITAGKKPGTGKEKRRIYQPEPEVFYDRFAEAVNDRNPDEPQPKVQRVSNNFENTEKITEVIICVFINN